MAAVNSLTTNAKGIGILAIVVIVVLAVLQGFQDSGSISGDANTTAGDFISGLGEFGTFATVIVLAIVGFFIISFVSREA